MPRRREGAGADRPNLRAGSCGPADRRPLHHGASRGRRRAGAARRQARASLALGNLSLAHWDARAPARARAERGQDRRRRTRRYSPTVRERWLGATGRKVPEMAVEGEIDVPASALVLDDVPDLEALRSAHAQGRPVLVRASTPEGVREALARPEVACVLVPPDRRNLLDLNLTELTYG